MGRGQLALQSSREGKCKKDVVVHHFYPPNRRIHLEGVSITTQRDAGETYEARGSFYAYSVYCVFGSGSPHQLPTLFSRTSVTS